MAMRRRRVLAAAAAVAALAILGAAYLILAAGPKHLELVEAIEAERVTLRIYRADVAMSADQMRADLQRMRVPEGDSVTAVVYGPDAELPDATTLERLEGDRTFNAILQPPNDRWQWIMKVNSRGERVIRRNR